MVSLSRRASAYDLFTGAYGIAWFLGSTAVGVLFGFSLGAVGWRQLAAIPMIWLSGERQRLRKRAPGDHRRVTVAVPANTRVDHAALQTIDPREDRRGADTLSARWGLLTVVFFGAVEAGAMGEIDEQRRRLQFSPKRERRSCFALKRATRQFMAEGNSSGPRLVFPNRR